jgi:hypothetical protein
MLSLEVGTYSRWTPWIGQAGDDTTTELPREVGG